MSDTIDLSSSTKEEAVDKFKWLLANTDHGKTSKGGGKCLMRSKRRDSVDGNPGAAMKQCYPYSGYDGLTMGVNGPRGGRSGSGTYGD